MALSNNGDICIAGSSNEELKFVAKFLLSILSLAIKNFDEKHKPLYLLGHSAFCSADH